MIIQEYFHEYLKENKVTYEYSENAIFAEKSKQNLPILTE